MTLPDERYRSLVHTKQLLIELLDPTKTLGIPRDIRRRASSCLRHWPDNYHLQEITRALPQHFAERMEPLYRMIKQHSQSQSTEDSSQKD